jgi:hypothetical protein
MAPKRLTTLLIIMLLWWLHGNLAFAGQGCCSTHGGVAGCAEAKLQCNDGTLSATCSCQDGSKTVPPIPRAQDGLALLEPTPPEATPYITPVGGPGPVASVDTIPSVHGNKPYVTPAAQPETSNQGDTVPSQKPPEPYSTQGAPTKKNVGQYQPPPKKLPGFPDATPAKSKTPYGAGKLRKRWKTADGEILEWDYQHGKVEKYDKRGKHKGEFDPNTGEPIPGKGPEASRKVEP